MANNETSPAALPWYIGQSKCDGVYGSEEHWAIFADNCAGVVADIEGGLSEQSRTIAAFIVRACNAHDDMLAGLTAIVNDIEDMVASEDSGIDSDTCDWLLQLATHANKEIAKATKADDAQTA